MKRLFNTLICLMIILTFSSCGKQQMSDNSRIESTSESIYESEKATESMLPKNESEQTINEEKNKTPQTYKTNEVILLDNATINISEILYSETTPPDEFDSWSVADEGYTFICVNFSATTKSESINTFWLPNDFICYVTSVSGNNYEMPFSQGTTGFKANENFESTVYIQIPESEEIASVTVSDGLNNTAIVLLT